MKKTTLPEIIVKTGEPFAGEYDKILKKIKEFKRIVVFRHIMPDFDALGTQMGLATWLKDNFPDKEIHVVGDNHVVFTPRLFPEMDSLKDEWFNDDFLAIIVDVSNASRVADPRFQKAKCIIKLDHHPDIENFQEIKVVETSFCAASELVVNMLLNFKGKYTLSKEAANYFYIGIVGDSGRFLYSATSAHTFVICEQLLKAGININAIYQKMYVKKIEDLYVTAYILNHFNVSEHGVAYYVLDEKTQKELNITTERGKENVNLFSNIEGIGAWCSITEDPKDQCWRVSIRSKEKPINGVATMFEGGGHAQASGAKLNSLDDLPRFINELDKLFL